MGETLIRAEIVRPEASKSEENTSPEALEVAILLDGNLAGITTHQTLHLTKLQPGQHMIVARKNGYSDSTEQITIQKGENPERLLRLSSPSTEPGEVLDVYTSRPNCEIILDDRWFEKANDKGACFFAKVSEGNHCLKVKVGDSVVSRAFLMKDVSKEVDFRLPNAEGEGPCPAP
jgi:hypothetical protein